MKKTILIFGLIFLLIGVSITPSTGIIFLEESLLPILPDKPFDASSIVQTYTRLPDTIDSSKLLFSDGKIAYGYDLLEWYGQCYFSLDDPGNITYFIGKGSPPVLVGGTWTNGGRWICCEYGNGILWEIDPENGNFYGIGGGGAGLNGLAYDPVNEKLYGASSNGSSGGLFEIELNTGEQTYIGSFINTASIVGIAFDAYGVLYGWDVGTDNLWTIDTETGEATLVGPLGIDLAILAQDGAFDYEKDILYLSAYTENPYYGGYLYECDEDTGYCYLIGSFGDWVEIDALAIPYTPVVDFTWAPTLPNPDETILFNASESFNPNGYITLYEWDWDNDGIYDENYTTPTATHSWLSQGKYPVTLRVTGDTGSKVMKTKTVRVGNQPPDAPIITGPTSGTAGIEYEYNFSLYDPDGDSIYLRVDWGNGTISQWYGRYSSPKIKKLSHMWGEEGTFTIRAQSKDDFGVSDWSELTVTMPRDKSTSSFQFLRFLERFPLLERLIFYFIK